MQLDEAAGITGVFREGEATRAAATTWFQQQALTACERRFAKLSGGMSLVFCIVGVLAIGAWLGAFLRAVPAFAVWQMAFVGVSYAAIVALLWVDWAGRVERKILKAHDTGEWGSVELVFDAEGVTMRDALRNWRGVSQIGIRGEGLFIAMRGPVFYLPNGCWDDPARRHDEMARSRGFWGRAGERAA